MRTDSFSGTVVRGVDLGARFGIATANIDTDFSEIKIEEGVYFVTVSIQEPPTLHKETSPRSNPTSQIHQAIMHYGPRKTFGGEKSIEIHLLDFSGDLYGKRLEVAVQKFHRPIQKFPNADTLFTQIERDIVQAKKYFWRQTFRQKWSLVTQEKKHVLVQKSRQKLSEFEPFRAAKNILLFVPMADEIPYAEDVFYAFPAKKFYWPRIDIDTKSMRFFSSDWEDLVPGDYTLEPKISVDKFDTQTTEKTLILVPALGVSLDGKRLGRGAGFYDRFLSECVGNKNISTVSVQPSFAVIDNLPMENHDQVLDEVIVV